MFVDVSFNLPIDRTWTYNVPDHLKSFIKVGGKIIASFLKEPHKLGVIVNIHYNTPSFNTKPIDKILQDGITLPDYIFFMKDAIADYYGCSYNEALHLFVFETYGLYEKISENKTIKKVMKKKNFTDINTLNTEQKQVLKSILEQSKNLNQFHSGLIYGITGSGKTQIYKELIKTVIKNNKQALLLLPEIGLTTQINQRFLKEFDKEDLVFIHSRITPKEKYKAFLAINKGEAKIIIGPRSAFFAPFNNLGLIIMDEENDFSYKSHKSPRYHTKRVAYILAKQLNIPFLMGSATPSIETYFAAVNKQLALYTLENRFFQTSLPHIHMVDMNKENEIFSPILMQNITETKHNKKQSILFLNRRGFSPLLFCSACNFIFKCPNCSISLTFHKSKKTLICHYCNYKQILSKNYCPECHKIKTLKSKGLGTQRIEEEIKTIFHNYRIARMDKDSTRKKNAYEDIINAFSKGETDILIGTQMVSKGLDFPLVELVGIISCDLILNLPDFRSSEHIFSLITQVAGRSGRKTQGKVVLQTRYTDHYAITNALKHDYSNFFKKEIQLRKQYNYPPYIKLIRLLVRSTDIVLVEKTIEKLFYDVQKALPKIEILGPCSCILEKLNHQYRHHMILKVKDPTEYTSIIKNIIKKYNNKGNYHIECDVDPITLL